MNLDLTEKIEPATAGLTSELRSDQSVRSREADILWRLFAAVVVMGAGGWLSASLFLESNRAGSFDQGVDWLLPVSAALALVFQLAGSTGALRRWQGALDWLSYVAGISVGLIALGRISSHIVAGSVVPATISVWLSLIGWGLIATTALLGAVMILWLIGRRGHRQRLRGQAILLVFLSILMFAVHEL